jgi:hypothetical protein
MATIKMQGGKVILNDSKVSCTCCCGFLTITEFESLGLPETLSASLTDNESNVATYCDGGYEVWSKYADSSASGTLSLVINYDDESAPKCVDGFYYAGDVNGITENYGTEGIWSAPYVKGIYLFPSVENGEIVGWTKASPPTSIYRDGSLPSNTYFDSSSFFVPCDPDYALDVTYTWNYELTVT